MLGSKKIRENHLKPVLLLSIALFLAVAPSPDSDVFSEISAGFLSSTLSEPLLAAEPDPSMKNVQQTSVQNPEQL